MPEERDPLELLSAEIGRPEQPDPTFASNLLDRLLDELADDASTNVTPIHVAVGEDAASAADDVPSPDVLELITPPTPPSGPSHRGGLLLRVAAILLLFLGGLALLAEGIGDERQPVDTTDTEEVPPTTIEQEQPDESSSAAEQLAADFLAARNAHDGQAMIDMLADNALIVSDSGVDTPDDYLARSEFERLTNTEIDNITCSALAIDRASCVFSLQTDLGRHLRTDGYRSELVITVSDGRIVDLLAADEGFTHEDDGTFFLDWLGRTHPEDLAVVADESRQFIRLTPESGAVLAARLPEFAETTLPPITTLLAGDPRFTALRDALTRTSEANELTLCTAADLTLFAPTDVAIERHISASGLDREALLGDNEFFEAFVVREPFALADSTGQDVETIDLATLSGGTITVVGGEEPSVQGVPIVGDIAGTEACNGRIVAIDDIYLADTQ